jgi:hypothetical protein
MSTNQKALIVRTGTKDADGLDELNIELERGWRVAEISPMGGAGGGDVPVLAALVILEHSDRPEHEPQLATEAVEQVEENPDEVVDDVVDEIDDVVEGDGI